MATTSKWRRRRGGGAQSLDRNLSRRIRGILSRRFIFRSVLVILAVIAILPPVYFHFKLRRIHQIKELGATHVASHDTTIPTMEDALKFISSSVEKVVVDAKVGPPSYEKGLAADILSVLKTTQCKNCVVWAKSDNLVRDVNKQSQDVPVGYIVMMNFSSGTRTNLLRMRDAQVVGIFHGLVDEAVVKILHRRNKKVYAWTVDDEAAMHKMLNENVDAIITSHPTLLQTSMRDVRKKCLIDGYSLGS